LGSVGTLNERKNQRLLISAVARLVSDRPNLLLVLVGDGDQRPLLERQVRRSGLEAYVRFLGAKAEAWRFMSAFDLYCLPSRNEGMPNSVMEAAATGLPVVATDVGGTSEVVIHGETGLLVRSGDVDHLTARLSDLLQNRSLARRLGRNGRKLMRNRFSIGQLVERRQSLYVRVASSMNAVRSCPFCKGIALR
jgi:glycosyltransferase involved in cell wall biosynthesis